MACIFNYMPYIFSTFKCRKKNPANSQLIWRDYTDICLFLHYSSLPYSLQLLIGKSSSFIAQNAFMKADARRVLVISGTLRSMEARRILYPLSSSVSVRFLGIFTTRSILWL